MEIVCCGGGGDGWWWYIISNDECDWCCSDWCDDGGDCNDGIGWCY